jgi:DNA-binding IclR family transcriptional regulator
MSEIIETVHLPASTTFRLLQALVESGFAEQNPATKRYSLGHGFAALVPHSGDPQVLRTIAHPCLVQLRDKLNETAYLSIMVEDQIEYVDVIPSDNVVRIIGVPGERGPLYATSQGKAILAFLDPAECDQILNELKIEKLTMSTLKDLSELRADLAAIRSRGYSINNMEREDGIRGVSAPVLDAAGHAIASVCAAAPAFRLTLSQIRKTFAPQVISTADEISRRVKAAIPSMTV